MPLFQKAIFHTTVAHLRDLPADSQYEVAFAGRSNSGKSSAINTLANHSRLAFVSKTPGRTQHLNYFRLEDGKYLVDLPGYGFAKVSQSSRRRWEQMIENYLRKRENLTMLFVLIDSRHSPQKIDLEFLENIKKWGVPCSIIFTKTDKENQRTVSKNVNDFKTAMQQSWQFVPQFFTSSAVKKSGRDKIVAFIDELNKEIEK